MCNWSTDRDGKRLTGVIPALRLPARQALRINVTRRLKAGPMNTTLARIFRRGSPERLAFLHAPPPDFGRRQVHAPSPAGSSAPFPRPGPSLPPAGAYSRAGRSPRPWSRSTPPPPRTGAPPGLSRAARPGLSASAPAISGSAAPDQHPNGSGGSIALGPGASRSCGRSAPAALRSLPMLASRNSMLISAILMYLRN